MKKFEYLLKNMGLFMIANFIPKILAFLMVPMYTRCLSTEDYGTADLLTNTVTLLMPILTLQVQDAVMRYAIQSEYSKEDILSSATIIAVFGGALLVFVVGLLKIVGIIDVNPVYIVFLCINYFTGSLANIFSYFCRGINEIKIITISSVVNSVITIGFNLAFLLVFKWGLIGYFAANSVGNIIRVIIIFFGARLYRFLHYSSELKIVMPRMIHFSIPMIFSALSWWINNASDKYLLTYFSGVSMVGIYAVASKIPTILSTLGDVIAKAFSISAIKEFDSKDEDGFLGKSYATISSCMSIVCSFLMIINIFVSKYLFSNDFFLAWKYVPPLLVSVLFNQLSWSCENILLAVGKTKFISYTAVLGAVVNTICNLILIPVAGAYGAAIATIIGFFTAWIYRLATLIKIVDLKNDFKKESRTYFVLLIQMFLAYWGNKLIALQILIFLLILLLSHNEIRAIIRKFSFMVSR